MTKRIFYSEEMYPSRKLIKDDDYDCRFSRAAHGRLEQHLMHGNCELVHAFSIENIGFDTFGKNISYIFHYKSSTVKLERVHSNAKGKPYQSTVLHVIADNPEYEGRILDELERIARGKIESVS